MAVTPSVLIIINPVEGYARAIMRGVLRFVRAHTDWECIQILPPVPDAVAMRDYGMIQGVIAEARTTAEVRALENLDAPAVIVAGVKGSTRAAHVIADNVAVGCLAFEHFRGLGFRSFAFAAWPDAWLAEVRGGAYAQRVREAGYPLHDGLPAPTGRRRRDQQILNRWIRNLPHHTAVFAVDDRMGRDTILAARNAGIAVPEQIAVLGVDNDELVCELTSPPLSSIDNGTFQIGYQAAALLQRLMNGEKDVGSPLIISPPQVVTRQSTETLAVEHPRVVAALRYIRQFACDGIGIADILHHAPGSRRALEREVRRVLGRTLQQELTRVRMERARQFLRETDLSMIDIAERTSISSASQFSIIFKRETGLTPTRYRHQDR